MKTVSNRTMNGIWCGRLRVSGSVVEEEASCDGGCDKDQICCKEGGWSAYLIISVTCLAPALLRDIPALRKLLSLDILCLSPFFPGTIHLALLVSHADMVRSPKMPLAGAWVMLWWAGGSGLATSPSAPSVECKVEEVGRSARRTDVA